MIVTIIHDTDCVKYQINTLRFNLCHVKPSITFKSCCVWEFTERVLEENSHLFMIVSEENRRFAKLFLDTLTTHKTLVIERKCQVCVVLEGQDSHLVAEYEGLPGTDRVSAVEDMHNALRWLPKVCTFFYQNRKCRKMVNQNQLNCMVPKIYEDAKSNELRQSFIHGLTDLGIKVLDEFQEDVKVCCILHKKWCQDFESKFKARADAVLKQGGIIIEYTLTEIEDPNRKGTNCVKYGRNNLVLFVLHVLFVLNLWL